MARRLDVYLENDLTGFLEQDDSGRLLFRYADSWLANPGALALSQSLPLRAEPFGNREARPFFAGLLPEAEKRDLVAKALGVSKNNDFALLDRIGGECAGAITFMHDGEAPPVTPTAADYRPLDEKQIARILELLPDRPLLAGEEGVRLSLAGAQDKLPVLVVDGEMALPLHGAPSSHVLKPPIRRYEDTVVNEAFCLALAKAAGLHVVNAALRRASGTDYLLVERYDRKRDSAGALRRIHQEDFCQALGYAPELKYQSEGGPSLEECFELVRRASARPVIDLARLLDAVLLNFLIGNNDAHGKNYSLLHGEQGAELAPLYDLSSTVVYTGLSPRLAMKIGGKYDADELHSRHWDRFAKDAGFSPAQVRRRVIDWTHRLPGMAIRQREELAASGQDRPVLARIVEAIEKRAERVAARFGE